MLNLNAMFGFCESVFEDKPLNRSISPTELQIMEMEITTDLANVEVDNIKASATMSQLDQLLNMYNHVKKFGIDRTFLSLYNSNNQLNNMLGVKFPSCESVNSVGNVNSNISRTFIVAMEDEKEGIFSKIWEFIKKIIKKIVDFFKNVWTKVKEWVGLKTKDAKKKVEEIKSADIPDTIGGKIKRYVSEHPVKTAVIAATVLTATVVIGRDIQKGLSIEKDLKNVEQNLEKADKNIEQYFKGMSHEDAMLKGKQLTAEAEKLLKQLDENNEVDKIVDKINAKLDEIRNFIDTHADTEYTRFIDTDEALSKRKDKIIEKRDKSLEELNKNINENKDRINHNSSYYGRRTAKALTRLGNISAKLTKAYKDNCSRNIEELGMIYNIKRNFCALRDKFYSKVEVKKKVLTLEERERAFLEMIHLLAQASEKTDKKYPKE